MHARLCYAYAMRGLARTLATALGMAALAIGIVPACEADGTTGDAECPAELAQRLALASDVAQQLEQEVVDLTASLAVAFANIAEDLGVPDVPDVGDGSGVTLAELDALYEHAAAATEQAIEAGGSLSIAVTGGLCLVDVDDQWSCLRGCAPAIECASESPADLCPPNAQWGQCSGACVGPCVPETGSTAACAGNCSGTCTGDCSGTCAETGTSGACDSKCEGTCSGECDGTCDLLPPAASCPGLCNGGCSSELAAPACAEPLDTTDCGLPDDCECLCSAQAVLAAECTAVSVVVTGNPPMKDTFEENLPAILWGWDVRCALLLDTVRCLDGIDALTDPACAEVGQDIQLRLLDVLPALSDVCSPGQPATASPF